MALPTGEVLRLGHLLRRAGFGARPEEWTAYAALGVNGATDTLLHPEDVPDDLDAILHDISGDFVDFGNIDSIRTWWIYRMAHTKRPLVEKMTLFWHNHFATANYKVDNPQWMWQQNELFRTNALGNFRTLLHGVSRDPAMLIWLDGDLNKKGKANENYGRELQELFTLGFDGGYTEADVKAAARAFTGWRFSRDTGAFEFDAASHDDGIKTFLGETGNFNGDDILDILVRNPSTAKFVCTKLFKFFVHDAPSPAEIEPLTTAYFQSGYEIRSVLQAIFMSPSFYSERAVYTKFKSPAEYLVIAMRTLDVPLTVANNAMPITSALRAMGQDLFNPPNVKGWPEGKAWVNTMTLLTRINYATFLTAEMNRRSLLTPNVYRAMMALGLPAEEQDTAPQMVDAVWAAFMPGHIPSEATRNALIAAIQNDRRPGPVRFEGAASDLVSLVLSAPEYQLA